jgi:uncharacterized protein (DUF1015 family)
MTVFRPFAALRYSASGPAPYNVDDLIAPPYDVLSSADREVLEGKHPLNSVRLDYPHGADDPNAYIGAGQTLETWIASKAISIDETPTFSIYRMTATDESGATRQTTGVIGGLGLEPPGTGDVLPHEETTSKDKADRLNLIRATRINTSPIWGLSLSAGLGELLTGLANSASPLARGVDEEGVIHEVWRVSDPVEIRAIQLLTEQSSVVIADGHHRFETGLAYLSERDTDGTASEHTQGIMALLVELADDQLVVRAIHRLVNLAGTGSVTEVVHLLQKHFIVTPTVSVDPSIAERMAADGVLTLITESGTWSLEPKPESFDSSVQLDSTRVRIALADAFPNAEIRYQHSVKTVLSSVASGDSSFGILLRPATVKQIRDVAHMRTRMPAKTTFFWPKPRTGITFRPVD